MAGIIDTIQLAGVLVLAIPAALAGLELALVRGQPLVGGILLTLAVGLVLVERIFTIPTGVSSLLALVVGRSDAPEPEDEPEE